MSGFGLEFMRAWEDGGFYIRLYDRNEREGGKHVVQYEFHDTKTGFKREVAFPVGMGTAIDADEVVEHCVSCVLDDYHDERADSLRRILDDMRNEEHKGEYWQKYHATHPFGDNE